MRVVNRYAGGAILVALVMAAAAAVLLKIVTINVFGDKGPEFLGNLLLNIVAELIGFAVGIILAVKIASKLANDKLNKLAPHFVRLVAELRRHKTINEKAARSSVICAVGIISEDSLSEARSTDVTQADGEVTCAVCTLTTKTRHSPKGKRCAHCNLEGNIWDIAMEDMVNPTPEAVSPAPANTPPGKLPG